MKSRFKLTSLSVVSYSLLRRALTFSLTKVLWEARASFTRFGVRATIRRRIAGYAKVN